MLYGSSMALKRSFLEAETPFKKKTLLAELKAILQKESPKEFTERKPDAVATAIHVERPKVAAIEPVMRYAWSEQPDEMEKEIHARWKPLFVEMMDNVSRIGDVARAGKTDFSKKKEAEQMALHILRMDEKIEAIYEERYAYLSLGKLPEQFPYGEPSNDPLQWPLKIANHKRYIRETKIKIAKKPGKESLKNLLKKHEWFVDCYENKLKQC